MTQDKIIIFDTTLRDGEQSMGIPTKLAEVIDLEIISFYKNLGDDCQATINSVLKAYMLVQEHRV